MNQIKYINDIISLIFLGVADCLTKGIPSESFFKNCLQYPIEVQQHIFALMNKFKQIATHLDSDTDIDDCFAVNYAYILYWDINHNVIVNTTMYAETVYPLNIVEAIRIFAPNAACGANVTFVSVVGESKMIVIKF